MKKLFLAIIAIALISSPILVAAEQGLEKISNQNEIKFHYQIKKVGNTLYGKQKEFKKCATSTASGTLEKIPSPDQVKFFEKIKRFGNTLCGVRIKPEIIISSSTIACVQRAIDKKEATIIAAITAHSSSTITALNTRNTCKKEAITLNEKSEIAKKLNICSQNYHKAIKEADKILLETKKEANKIYKSDLVACSGCSTCSTTTKDDIIISQNILQD